MLKSSSSSEDEDYDYPCVTRYNCGTGPGPGIAGGGGALRPSEVSCGETISLLSADQETTSHLSLAVNGGGPGSSPGHHPSRLSVVSQTQMLPSLQQPRACSPTPSFGAAGVDQTTGAVGFSQEQEAAQREEENRKLRLQLYIFILRCIAYPFSSKQPVESVKRYYKLTRQQLQLIKERFQAFLKGELQIACDEAFTNAVHSYYEVFLRSDRVASLIKSGGCSLHDCREVFNANIEKRVRCLPEIDGLSKETVLSAWKIKFDQICRGEGAPVNSNLASGPSLVKFTVPQPELVMTREQLYDLFQNVLGIKKYEHQILFNACQLDSADEQAAQVRRELGGRQQKLEEIVKTRRYPRFVVKGMEVLYYEEHTKQINELILHLESVPVAKGPASSSFQRLKKYSRGMGGGAIGLAQQQQQMGGRMDELEAGGSPGTGGSGGVLTKLDITLNFNIEVVVVQVKNLRHLPGNKILYCTLELDGSTSNKLKTDQAEASRPRWETSGEFQTNQPLPVVKVKLYKETSGALSLDDRELGRVVLRPTCSTSRQLEWHKMQITKHCPDLLEMQLIVRMEKSSNLKYSGDCWIMGKSAFRKWKRRYLCLIQVSQYTFVMASYRERRADPLEIMQLDGFTVDYCDPHPQFCGDGAKQYFNLVKEGDSVLMATNEELERQQWVQAIYRATGQAHKPVVPYSATGAGSSGGSLAVGQRGGPPRISSRIQGEAERARKHGLDELVAAHPYEFQHDQLFGVLQSLTLTHRLQDAYLSLGWLSPGQTFVLDEYCARYGVRECQRHIAFLNDLLDKAEQGIMIDPDLIHLSYSHCAGHVCGNNPDRNVWTVLASEREQFMEINRRLFTLLERQITEFRYCFPFGCPEGALKKTLGLLERVLMKESGAPAAAEDVRSVIRMCLRNAALVNYNRISEYAFIEASTGLNVRRDDAAAAAQPNKKLEDVMHLAELCIEVLEQNEEHHAESFAWFSDLLVEHAENFWSLFQTDMNEVLDQLPPDNWDTFPLFQLLNDYLRTDDNLCSGRFHQSIVERFEPQVTRYVDLMQVSISQSLLKGFELERWQPVSVPTNQDSGNSPGPSPAPDTSTALSPVQSCATTTDLLWKLQALETFIHELYWPERQFAMELDRRVKLLAADMLKEAARRIQSSFENCIKRMGRSTDVVLPGECCVMMNSLMELRANVFKLCKPEAAMTIMRGSSVRAGSTRSNHRPSTNSNANPTLTGHTQHQYHKETDECLETGQQEMASLLIDKLVAVLESVLSKLARYDENKFISSLLSLAKPVDEEGKAYVSFLLTNLQHLCQRISDELFTLSLCEAWYTAQMRLIFQWLSDRKDLTLHPYQLTCFSSIVKKIYSDFELQGVSKSILDTTTYQIVCQRLQVEEATHSVRQDQGAGRRSLLGNISGSIGSLTPTFFNRG